MPKREKVSEIGPSPLKVSAAATDDAADDGRVGIWKAPLPDGTAELIKVQQYYNGMQVKNIHR